MPRINLCYPIIHLNYIKRGGGGAVLWGAAEVWSLGSSDALARK